jgi:hypothetical protein
LATFLPVPQAMQQLPVTYFFIIFLDKYKFFSHIFNKSYFNKIKSWITNFRSLIHFS